MKAIREYFQKPSVNKSNKSYRALVAEADLQSQVQNSLEASGVEVIDSIRSRQKHLPLVNQGNQTLGRSEPHGSLAVERPPPGYDINNPFENRIPSYDEITNQNYAAFLEHRAKEAELKALEEKDNKSLQPEARQAPPPVPPRRNRGTVAATPSLVSSTGTSTVSYPLIPPRQSDTSRTAPPAILAEIRRAESNPFDDQNIGQPLLAQRSKSTLSTLSSSSSDSGLIQSP